LEIARVLQAELEHEVDGTVWYQGVFGLSQSGLEALEAKVRTFDFAALVLTPDDLVTKRGESGKAPRDNVLFEAGLFIGALGRGRVFLVSCRDEALDLPSDLDGITPAQFNRREDLRAAIGPAATNIRAAIKSAPNRPMAARSEAERDREERGHVLSLVNEVMTELETNRYHLDDARERRQGWGANDMLQAAKFDKWQKDPRAAVYGDVMDALRGIYVWQHQKNKEMQRREAAAWNAIGTTVHLAKDLSLDDDDIRDLCEGMSRIMNAQEHLRQLFDELSGAESAQPAERAQAAKSTDREEEVSTNRDASDTWEALAIGMKPALGVRTILGVHQGEPTGELFLEVNNTSGWTAKDVQLEVIFRDGRVDTDTRESMDPDRHLEPRWTVLLQGVKPANVDVFAEVRAQIESVVLTYSDERDIARYELRLTTASMGDPFDPAVGEEQRVR